MRVLDLFSGIGGFSLGLEASGMTTTAFCERDEFCTKILNKHWPDVPVHNDVRKLDGTKYAGSIDVVCGGFPCQPFSVAGQQRGKDDDRHLWPEMLRVISESKPRWVIGENVSGFVRMALDDVSLDLENEGYEVRPFVLPACAVDAKHRRDRVFIIAYKRETMGNSKHDGLSTPKVARSFGETQERSPQGSFKAIEPERAGRPSDHGAMVVANATGEGLQGWKVAGDAEGKGTHTNEQFAGFGYASGRQEWVSEPAVGRVADGVPNRVDRIKSLGNAVVPQLIQIIGELVLAADKEMNHEH
tara:strand:+ start:149 stop:1051 length:903 start_codon:yes stop_codon:yes gene_type:complete